MSKNPAPNLELQRERFKQQMSRSALSRRSGITTKTLADIEKRRSAVRLDTAARIAQAFPEPVQITDIFTFDEVIG